MRSFPPRTRGLSAKAVTRYSLAGGLVLGLIGCGNIDPVQPHEEPITDPAQLYMHLTIDYRAVNLSTDTSRPEYYTAHLTATPGDALGNPMPGLPAATFRLINASDTTKVKVTSDGLLTAVAVTAGAVKVIASLTVGPVTHHDTALVAVRALAPPPRPATLSVDPVPPDSAIMPLRTLGAGEGLYRDLGFARPDSLSPIVTDSAGSMVDNLIFDVRSLDLTIASADQNVLKPVKPGQVNLVARTLAYGVGLTDTVTFTITPPTLADFQVQNDVATGAPIFFSLGPDPGLAGTNEIRIAPYGLVFWFNFLTDTADVTFDDPANVAAGPEAFCTFLLFGFGTDFCGGPGNAVLPPGFPEGVAIRQFPLSGIYPFHSTRTGATGRVVVSNDPQ